MADPLRLLIVEDEAAIARRIARVTTDFLGPRLAPISFANNFQDARAAIESDEPDIMVLDLNLNGEEGFDLLRPSQRRRCATIVVSAHTNRALEGFDHGVCDFVPKPFSRARLELALHRAIELRTAGPELLGVRSGSGTTFVPFREIVFVRAAGLRSELVLESGRVLAHDQMLEALERILPPAFERIHRSVIVDVGRVDRLISQQGSRYRIVLHDGRILPVGRTRVESLRKRLA